MRHFLVPIASVLIYVNAFLSIFIIIAPKVATKSVKVYPKREPDEWEMAVMDQDSILKELEEDDIDDVEMEEPASGTTDSPEQVPSDPEK